MTQRRLIALMIVIRTNPSASNQQCIDINIKRRKLLRHKMQSRRLFGKLRMIEILKSAGVGDDFLRREKS
jgi:hypothetical protein